MIRLLTLAPALVSAGLMAACGSLSKQGVPPAFPPLEAAELGSMHNVSVSDGLWFGGLPTADDLDLARRRGIERVIVLCEPELLGGHDLQSTCADLGLECVDLGLRQEDPIPAEAVDRVIAFLGENPRRRTLMFCEDGSRSATLFAIHRVVNDGMALSEALVEARRSGMRPGEPEGFVELHVGRLATAAAGSRPDAGAL